MSQSPDEAAVTQLVDALAVSDQSSIPFSTCLAESFSRLEFKVGCAGRTVVSLEVVFMRPDAQLLDVPLGRLTNLTSLKLRKLPPMRLPSTVGLLTALRSLDLPDSALGGLLPSELARLTRLTSCQLGAHNVLSRTMLACPLPPNLPAACAVVTDDTEGPDAPPLPLRCNPIAATSFAGIATPPATRAQPKWWGVISTPSEWRGVISFHDGISRMNKSDSGRFVCTDRIYHMDATLRTTGTTTKIALGSVIRGAPSMGGRPLDPIASARLFDSPYFGQIPATGGEILLWQRRFGNELGAYDCALSQMPVGFGANRPFELYFTTDLLDCLNITPTVMCRSRDAPMSQWTATEKLYGAAAVALSIHRFRFDPMGELGELEGPAPLPSPSLAPPSDTDAEPTPGVDGTFIAQQPDAGADLGVIVGASIGAIVALALLVAAIIFCYVRRGGGGGTTTTPTSAYAEVQANDVFHSNASTQYALAPMPTITQSGAPIDNYALAPSPRVLQGSNAPLQHYAKIETYTSVPGEASAH